VHDPDDAVGFALPGGLPITVAGATDLLARADDAGFGPLLLTEVAGLDALVVAAAVASVRPGRTLGTGVLPFGSRTEPALAMGAASIASLAGAPFLLGVGVSAPAIVEGWHGATYEPTVDRTRARLRALRETLDGGQRGSFALRPPEPVDVRVLLGAMGPRMVDLALTETDGVIVNHTPPRALPEPRQSSRVYAYVWVRVTADADARARRELVSYATATPYARHLTRLGYGHDVETVARLRRDGRLRDAPEALSAGLVDELYVGLEQLPARLAAVRTRGAVPVVLPVTGDDPVGDVRRLLDADLARPA
jgi:alkanesulfonate monooxygenase SsuD/methylene tetrahydromethanopterin reductase-like flavin-dependent oxidoreductase (luciferase family)